MKWWLRTHRGVLQLCLCAAAVAAAPTLSSTGILLPSLGSTGLFVSAPLAVIVALLLGLVAAGVSARTDTAEWRTAARDLRVLAAVQMIGPFALVALGAGIWAAAQTPAALKLCLAALGVCGLQRLGNALLGARYQAAVPVVYVFIAALFGRVLGDGGVARWAWPIEPDPSRAAWVVVLVTLAVGLGADLIRARLGRPLLLSRPALQARAG